MIIAGSVKIQLDHEQQAETIISILKQDYESLAMSVTEITNIASVRELQSFERDDLADMLSTLEAMDRVLQNYMNPQDYEIWKAAWRQTVLLYSRTI